MEEKRFNIIVKPALKNRGPLYASKIFPASRKRETMKSPKRYDLEIVLKLAVDEERGVVWSPCYLNSQMNNEEIVLRRAVIAQEKLWMPVRIYSSNRHIELVMPRIVNKKADWVSAEGMKGYLKPVKISGVAVWIPTPNNESDLRKIDENIKRKGSTKKTNCKTAGLGDVICSNTIITGKKPSLKLLEPRETETQKLYRELCIVALETVARKLTTKLANAVFPNIALNDFPVDSSNEPSDDSVGIAEKSISLSLSATSGSETESNLPKHDLQMTTGGKRMRFIGAWESDAEEDSNAHKVWRQDLINGKVVKSFFLPGQEIPVITVESKDKNK